MIHSMRGSVASSRPFVGRLWSLAKLAGLTVCSDSRWAVEGVRSSTDCRVGHWIQVSSVAGLLPTVCGWFFRSSWDRNSVYSVVFMDTLHDL